MLRFHHAGSSGLEQCNRQLRLVVPTYTIAWLEKQKGYLEIFNEDERLKVTLFQRNDFSILLRNTKIPTWSIFSPILVATAEIWVRFWITSGTSILLDTASGWSVSVVASCWTTSGGERSVDWRVRHTFRSCLQVIVKKLDSIERSKIVKTKSHQDYGSLHGGWRKKLKIASTLLTSNATIPLFAPKQLWKCVTYYFLLIQGKLQCDQKNIAKCL